ATPHACPVVDVLGRGPDVAAVPRSRLVEPVELALLGEPVVFVVEPVVDRRITLSRPRELHHVAPPAPAAGPSERAIAAFDLCPWYASSGRIARFAPTRAAAPDRGSLLAAPGGHPSRSRSAAEPAPTSPPWVGKKIHPPPGVDGTSRPVTGLQRECANFVKLSPRPGSIRRPGAAASARLRRRALELRLEPVELALEFCSQRALLPVVEPRSVDAVQHELAHARRRPRGGPGHPHVLVADVGMEHRRIVRVDHDPQ